MQYKNTNRNMYPRVKRKLPYAVITKQKNEIKYGIFVQLNIYKSQRTVQTTYKQSKQIH